MSRPVFAKSHLGEMLVESGEIDIKDPVYDETVWCTVCGVPCISGDYHVYVYKAESGLYAKRNAAIALFKDDEEIPLVEMLPLEGVVGVDSAEAGFFIPGSPVGFSCMSGWGDGSYTAYANKEHTAFAIVFIEELFTDALEKIHENVKKHNEESLTRYIENGPLCDEEKMKASMNEYLQTRLFCIELEHKQLKRKFKELKKLGGTTL